MVKVYKESDLDYSHKVLPNSVAQALILVLVLLNVICFGLAILVLK